MVGLIKVKGGQEDREIRAGTQVSLRVTGRAPCSLVKTRNAGGRGAGRGAILE